MPDSQLIQRLVTDLKPIRPRRAASEAWRIAMLFALELVAILALGWVRPDMPHAMAQTAFWWKLCSLLLIALTGAVVSILSFNPIASPIRGLRGLAALVLACLLCGGLIHGGPYDRWSLQARLNWHDGLHCVAKMVALSLPALLGLGLLMRRAAATEPGATSLSVGMTAGAWGAFVFVFACPHDDPLYIAVWYMVGCGLVTLASRLMLPILTRW